MTIEQFIGILIVVVLVPVACYWVYTFFPKKVRPAEPFFDLDQEFKEPARRVPSNIDGHINLRWMAGLNMAEPGLYNTHFTMSTIENPPGGVPRIVAHGWSNELGAEIRIYPTTWKQARRLETWTQDIRGDYRLRARPRVTAELGHNIYHIDAENIVRVAGPGLPGEGPICYGIDNPVNVKGADNNET